MHGDISHFASVTMELGELVVDKYLENEGKSEPAEDEGPEDNHKGEF